MKKHREYTGIDLFKLFFSFFVIFIHCHPEGTLSFVIANGIGRLAVPFFFVVAGYFLAQKILSSSSEAWQTGVYAFLKRIFKMYLIWSAIYLPLMLVIFLVGRGYTPLECLVEYLRAFFFTGSFSHLWYLPALLTGAAIVSLLCKKLDLRVIFALGLLLFFVGIFNEAYSGLCPPVLKDFFEDLYNPVFERTRNGLFFGTVFVAMGFLFAKSEQFGKGILPDIVGTVCFTALMCLEGYLLDHYGISQGRYGMYLMALPATLFCFRLARKIELPIKEQTAYAMRKMSTMIYLLHQFVNGIVIDTLADTLLGLKLSGTMGGFLIIVLLTVPLSYVIVRAGAQKNKAGAFFRALS